MENITWVDGIPYVEDFEGMRTLTKYEAELLEMIEGEQYD